MPLVQLLRVCSYFFLALSSIGKAEYNPSTDRSFIASVTHIPQSSASTTESGPETDPAATETGYRRMILLEGMGKRVVIIGKFSIKYLSNISREDLNPCY